MTGGAWKYPPRAATPRPWLARLGLTALALTAAMMIAGLLIHIADKAITQAAFDAVNHAQEQTR